MGFAGFILYLGTNIDNALVVLACLSSRPRAWVQAVLSITISAFIVLALALGLSEALDDLGAWPLNLLGLVPLSLGVLALWRGPEALDAVQATSVFALVGVLLSNSSDTLVTLVSFLAERPDAVRLPVALGYSLGVAALALVVTFMMQRLAKRPRWARIAARIGPLVMISFGLFILLDTPGDAL
ncbi:MAG: hypothetical protein AAGF94_09840 [Pseudomonadota bacterium]